MNTQIEIAGQPYAGVGQQAPAAAIGKRVVNDAPWVASWRFCPN